jgi:hypothetical protein
VARLVLLVAEMLRLRTAPQQIPASNTLAWAAVIALAVASLLASQRLYTSDVAFGRVGLDLVIHVLFFSGILRWAGHPERFPQTFTAACGTSTLLVLLAWPLLDIVAERSQDDPLYGVATFMLLGINIWLVVVFGHILSHALEIRLRRGIALSLAFVLASVLIANAVFPQPQALAN